MKQSVQENLERVLAYIKFYSAENGYPPSVREIGIALKINSTATVHYYINKLQQRGDITKCGQKNRTLGIVGARKTNEIPLVGRVHAGALTAAEECSEDNFTFSDGLFRGNDLFMLTVKGDSMRDAGICDGDMAVIARCNTANHGDIVVAMHDDEATVKRLIIKNGKTILHPENPDYSDIIIENDLRIIGTLAGLIRRY